MSTHSQGPLPTHPDPARLVRLALLLYAGLAAAAAAWRVGWAGESLFFTDAAAAAAGPHPLRDLALGVAAGGALVAISWVATRGSAAGERLARAIARLLGRPSSGQIAALALASGIGEELFFRGALQPRVGLVAASLLFGLAHFVPRRDLLPWSLFAIAAGLVLGVLFEATGNLLAPIAAHAFVNGVNLTLLVRLYGD